MSPEEVLGFWFAESAVKRWFRATPEFDAEVRLRFEPTWRAAAAGALGAWEATPRGALALVIVLDQLPLNMFRDRPEGYSTEAASRDVAERAIASGFDAGFDDREKAFLYLPFMHSEALADQDRSVELFEAAGLADNLRWARHHRDIVHRFGRFPHRNVVFGRHSSAEELDWLASDEAFKP